MENILYFLEALLDQYNVWEIGDPDSDKAADTDSAIGSLMNLINTILPTDTGNGWKLSNFQLIKDFVRLLPRLAHSVFTIPPALRSTSTKPCIRPGWRTQKNVDTIYLLWPSKELQMLLWSILCIQCSQNNLNWRLHHKIMAGSLGQSADNAQDPTTREEGSGTSYFTRLWPNFQH